jgi:hypothetical protein
MMDIVLLIEVNVYGREREVVCIWYTGVVVLKGHPTRYSLATKYRGSNFKYYDVSA